MAERPTLELSRMSSIAPPTTTVMRLGVLGWPVAHSRSPVMQNAALRAVGLMDWRYQLLPVPPEHFAETVRALPALGFRGVNVTIPHKTAALALADRASRRAAAIGAANTLVFCADGTIEADNTDAPALVAALPFAPGGTSALVLGAGGSARAAVWALLDAGVVDVAVWNRTPARAEALCAELGGRPVRELEDADLLVQCTSTALDPGVDEFMNLPLDADEVRGYRVVVDFVYMEGGTDLLRAARTRGVQTVDGIELLVRQGALSFTSFTGREAPLEVMRDAAGATEADR
jgi:shikimate dehydrogenase